MALVTVARRLFNKSMYRGMHLPSEPKGPTDSPVVEENVYNIQAACFLASSQWKIYNTEYCFPIIFVPGNFLDPLTFYLKAQWIHLNALA